MAKNSTYNQEKQYTVYVILHPHTKQFFVHYAATSALRNAMKEHYTLKNIHTKDMFQEHRETIYPPEMYALHEDKMTRETCFVKKIIWIRYFKEHGYKPLNHEDDISSAEHLFEENLPEYEAIKEININNIICISNRKFSRYGRERMDADIGNNNERKQVKFFCTEEEYELIKQNAKKKQQTISAFLREVAIHTVSLNFNYDAITEHTKEINRIKSELNAVITMLVKTNQAFPKDIETLISLLDEINQTEKTMLQNTGKERQQVKKYITKILSK